MKNFSRILFVSITVILILCCAFTANAQEKVAFSAENTSTKNNRIFSISVSGNGDEILSAVKFVFEYDGNAIEYRNINSANDSSIIKEVEENGRLSLIFLNEKGVDLSTNPQLFTVSFKAENMSKNQEINFSVSDCVNSRVESISATGGKCLVTYLGNAEDDEDSDGNSSGRTDRVSANGSSGSVISEDEESDTFNENGDYDEYGEQENINSQGDYIQDDDESNGNILSVTQKDNTLKIFLSGAFIVIALAVICGVLYHLGRMSMKKKQRTRRK